MKQLGLTSSQKRKLIPIEVSDEMIETADQILQKNVDPNWDQNKFGCMIIGVTGKHRVFYTFWKYLPQMSLFGKDLVYMGNLSIDIVEAAKKAKSIAGIQPVFFEEQQTLKGLQGVSPEVITFGKYRGETIGEVYAKDPQYIIWMSKAMQPKNRKEQTQYELVKGLTEDFFRSLGEKNKAAETKEYFEIGKKFEGEIKITSLRADGFTYKVKAETDQFRFLFNLSFKSIAKALKIEYAETTERVGRDIYMIPNEETASQVKSAMQYVTHMAIAGKGKYQNEIVGKKWTRLSNVKADSLITKSNE